MTLLRPILTLLLCCAVCIVNAQEGKWIFKEIIQGNHSGSSITPDKVDIDVNEGTVEFSIAQKNNCTDKYSFTYRFSKDMNTLEVPVDRSNLPSYPYEFELTPLTKPCYDPVVSSYSNPGVTVTHWNAPSGVLGAMKKNNTWNYRFHQEWMDNGGAITYYAYKTKVYKNAGNGNGEYVVRGPFQKDVAYTLKNYPGMATDFRILFSGQSSISGKAADFKYNLLFMYELSDEEVAKSDNPCDIVAPNCSCCPGTIPVWNFESGKGDCLCPEGSVWDKMKNSCVPSK